MAQTALVDVIDRQAGGEVVKALEAANIHLKAALWVLSEDYYSDWRLVLSSKTLDRAGIAGAYGLINDVLSATGMDMAQSPPIIILSVDHPLIHALKKHFRRNKNVEGTRLGGQMLGDRFVDAAYVYRVS